MTLGCTALAIAGHAWATVAGDGDERRRTLLSHAISAFIADGILTAKHEISYSHAKGFSLASYIAVSTEKAAVYTRHPLLVAHALSGAPAILREQLTRLGTTTGLIIQLIDDLLDAKTDHPLDGNPITYPMFLINSGSALTPVYDLIDEQVLLRLGCAPAFRIPNNWSSSLQGSNRHWESTFEVKHGRSHSL